jgi:2-haloacid dehalogenase
MAQADDLKASIKVCMFDQYGTVVDMQTGLTEAAAPFFILASVLTEAIRIS